MKKLPKVGDVVWVDGDRVFSGAVEEVDTLSARIGSYWHWHRNLHPTKKAALVAHAKRREKSASEEHKRLFRAESAARKALDKAKEKSERAAAAWEKAKKAVDVAKGGR